MKAKELIIFAILITIVAVAVFFIVYPTGLEHIEATSTKPIARFILMSPAFKNGENIPEKYTCDGMDVSPPLSWSGFPAGTKSFVLIVEDPDAPGGIFTHWIAYNISSKITSLPENVKRVERLEDGILQGINSFGKIGYNGPCPPHGSKHRYYFRIYALDCYIDLPPGATRDEILKMIENHVIGEAELLGYYER
ncbi:MAG TPA: YbhB/YbcL family Raf kinase inhibitor-like protein [Nitrososphaeria archaeon]|nr:YbhB/YbcL family Raf kinase inhibitor-like protein [Nitrososphaeria archaeon]